MGVSETCSSRVIESRRRQPVGILGQISEQGKHPRDGCGDVDGKVHARAPPSYSQRLQILLTLSTPTRWADRNPGRNPGRNQVRCGVQEGGSLAGNDSSDDSSMASRSGLSGSGCDSPVSCCSD